MLENTKKLKNDYNISIKNQPLTKLLKNSSKKVYKNFGGYEKGYTFAPAKEESSASGVEKNNTYLDIMLYSTKKI